MESDILAKGCHLVLIADRGAGGYATVESTITAISQTAKMTPQ